MGSTDAASRFTGRADLYAQYRPGYPPELFAYLQRELGLNLSSVVADIGSGTGILTDSLLRFVGKVYAVEPNRAMRMIAEQSLGRAANFESVAGTAEATTLRPASVDLVIAAQAFHWFEARQAREEFSRILRPGGQVALVWNDRRTDSTPFLREYEHLLETLGTDYSAVNHRNAATAERLRAFFGSGGYRELAFENRQEFDWHGLAGRALSSSYVPAEGHENHAAFMARLRELFDQHAVRGRVAFEYDTRLYHGALA